MRTSSRTPAPVALDSETRVTKQDHLALRLWLRVLASANLIQTEVRSRLQAEFGITLPRFDLLAQLERAPEGLKMSELSRRMMVTGGNVTGIADALESEGLIERTADPQDRRVFRVRLTPEGRRTFTRMARRHEEWVVGLFASLPARDQKLLTDLLGRLKRSVATATTAGKS